MLATRFIARWGLSKDLMPDLVQVIKVKLNNY